MDISSNKRASFPQSLPGSVLEAQNQSKTTVTFATQRHDLCRDCQFNTPPSKQDAKRGAVHQLRTMATATIQGVIAFLDEKTYMWGFPTRSSAPSAPPAPPEPPEPPAPPEPPEPPAPPEPPEPPAPPAPAPSLIPPWAQIFEATGASEWRPGTPNQKSAIDLRKELAGKIEKLEILSPDGTQVIATGIFDRRGKDGRPRYKFNKAGSELPNGAIIKATLTPNSQGQAGGIRYIEIPQTNNVFQF